jgi:peptidoglycan/LPS O-acetylase OafA/YrhL
VAQAAGDAGDERDDPGVRDYRPDIDGLRAVAVIAVIVFHAFPGWLGGGFVGVDIFFVISGYLITGIIVRALEQGDFSFAAFYARRMRRILPALGVVLAVCYAVGWFELMPLEFRQLCRQILAAVAFVANFEFWSEASYFDGSAQAKPLLHLWSLGIEEQFYIFWPLALWLAWRWRRRAMLLTAAIVLVSFVWNVAQTPADPVAAFFSPATRIWELLAGALLVQINGRSRSGRGTGGWHFADLQAMLGAVLIGWSFADIDGSMPYPGWRALLPVVGTMLVIDGSASGTWLNRRVLAHPALVWIGLISYPLYLWHWPLLSFAHIVGTDRGGAGERLVLIAASFLLAVVTYRLVELPVRSGERLGAKAAALAAILLTIGFTAHLSDRLDGLAFRFPERLRGLAALKDDRQEHARRGLCWLLEGDPADGFAAECLRGRLDGGAKTVLLWGDSHAGRFYPGLRQAAPPDVDILELVRSSCPPILGVSSDICIKSNVVAMAEIGRIKPDTVLLFASWPDYRTAPHGPDLVQALEDTLRQIRQAGVGKIVIVGPAPRWNRRLYRLVVAFMMNHPELAEPPQHMAYGLGDGARRAESYVREVAKRQGAVYVSLLELMCNDEGCLASVPGSLDALTAWDETHLTDPASQWIAAKLLKRHILP